MSISWLLIFQGFAEKILTPLQSSTVLFKTGQRRAALDPPLLPIASNQILHGELSTLLEEDDYNLTTMVNSKFYTIYLANYLFIHSLWSSQKQNNFCLIITKDFKHLTSLSLFSCILLHISLYILHKVPKHIPLSNILEYVSYLMLLHYFLKYLLWNTGNLYSTFLFNGAPPKKKELGLFLLGFWIELET